MSPNKILPERERALGVALDAAREAAEVLQAGFRQTIVSSYKDGIELVTEYDRRCEDLIVGALRAAFPDHRIVGEESGHHGSDGEQVPTWFVDPLDGTVNFAHHLPWYAVSIGLRWQGVLELGVVLAPEFDWELTAIHGGGTQLNGAEVRVSETNSASDALVATGFPYDRSHFDNVDHLRSVLHGVRGVRRMGTASLDCLAVACGWLDGYWEYALRPWDVCAGALLVAEAGGQVSSPDQTPFSLESGTILATNGKIHAGLATLLR